MSKADKGIVTGSKYGDTSKATVLGLSKGALETYEIVVNLEKGSTKLSQLYMG